MKEITPEHLKELLSEKGMKQKDLADILSITQPKVSKIFNGLRSITAAESKLLRLYFYGEIPFDMIRPEDDGYSSALEFSEEEWHVMGILATRCGYGSAGEWIVSRIRAELAFMEHKEQLAKQLLAPSTPAENITPITHTDELDQFYLPQIAVAAGSPLTADALDDLKVDKQYSPGHFIATLNGDSMDDGKGSPTVDGARCLMLAKDQLRSHHCKKGEIYTFVVNGELTLKEFNTRLATPEEIERGLAYSSFQTGEQKVKLLRSLNPDKTTYPDLVVTSHDYTMTGWLVKVL